MITSAEEAGFLEAICAAPADDTPRLVYADWLQERDQGERAEFIRAQCALARAGGCHWPSDPVEHHFADGHTEYQPGPRCGRCPPCGLEARERDLWNRPLVLRELPDAGAIELSLSIDPRERATRAGVSGLVRRGFVEALVCSADDWLAHADVMAWSPHQEVRCPEPDCVPVEEEQTRFRRYVSAGRESRWEDCPRCAGTGWVLRPFVATAQPLTRVIITSRLVVPRRTHNATGSYYALCSQRRERLVRSLGPGSRSHATPAELLDAEWPWIDFDQAEA